MPEQVNSIDILKSSAGDPHGYHAIVDPYWKQRGFNSQRAAGDGGDYQGVIETVEREPGETDAAFEERAEARALELEAEM